MPAFYSQEEPPPKRENVTEAIPHDACNIPQCEKPAEKTTPPLGKIAS